MFLLFLLSWMLVFPVAGVEGDGVVSVLGDATSDAGWATLWFVEIFPLFYQLCCW